MGAWLRENFDKLLLSVLFVGLVCLVLFLSVQKIGNGELSWAREQSGTVLGALLGLITGRALAHSAQPPTNPPEAPK